MTVVDTAVSGLKDCPTCRRALDLSDFNRNRSRPDGLHGECTSCHRARNSEYHWRNRDRLNAGRQARWHARKAASS